MVTGHPAGAAPSGQGRLRGACTGGRVRTASIRARSGCLGFRSARPASFSSTPNGRGTLSERANAIDAGDRWNPQDFLLAEQSNVRAWPARATPLIRTAIRRGDPDLPRIHARIHHYPRKSKLRRHSWDPLIPLSSLNARFPFQRRVTPSKLIHLLRWLNLATTYHFGYHVALTWNQTLTWMPDGIGSSPASRADRYASAAAGMGVP